MRTNINRALFVGAHVDGGIPVEAQLLLVVIRLRLDVAAIQRMPVDAANISALGFGVDPIRIRRVGKHPESIAAEQVLPTRIADAAGIR